MTGFFNVPNVAFLFASLIHLAGMAFWLGGVAALAAVARPTLRHRDGGGDAFDAMLERFQTPCFAAIAAAIAGAGAKAIIGGQNPNVWMTLRDLCFAAGGFAFALSTLFVRPAMRRPESRTRMERAWLGLAVVQVVLGAVVLLFA